MSDKQEGSENRWKGYVLGLCGGMLGVSAMNAFMRKTSDYFRQDGQQPAKSEKSISLVGRKHRKDESATNAVGRIVYTKLAGNEPQSEELKYTLGQMVHWGYGIEMGGCYGYFRPSNGFLNLKDGLSYGAGLWLAGDEIAVPLLGLSEAPSAHPPGVHAQAFLAHLVYGATTAASICVLRKIFGK